MTECVAKKILTSAPGPLQLELCTWSYEAMLSWSGGIDGEISKTFSKSESDVHHLNSETFHRTLHIKTTTVVLPLMLNYSF